MPTPNDLITALLTKTQDGTLSWVLYQGMYNVNHGGYFYRIDNPATETPSLFVSATLVETSVGVKAIVDAITGKALDMSAVLESLGS